MLPPPDFPTLGGQVVDWIEAYLCHGPGDVQGEPILLDAELATFIHWAYRLREDTGARVYRRAFLSRPKGRAKSELAGMIACAELLGPVRFDGWAADGTPVGRPLVAPFIRPLATEEGQTGNTYDNVRVMLEHVRDHHGADYPGLDPGLTRTFYGTAGGEVRPSTSSSASKDGGKETFAVADETHLWTLPDLKRLHATVRRNLVKRKRAEPWMLETSTMYAPGEGSVAEETHEYAKAIADGRLRDDSLLFDHREIPEGVDWASDEEVLAALANVYGPFAAELDLERILAEIRDPQTTEEDGRRYFGNQVVARSSAAFDLERWRDLAAPELVVPDRELITLGFDGARFRDATALIGVTVAGGHLFELGLWERPLDAGDDWEVPVEEVNAAVAAAFDRFEVWRMYADPPYWDAQVDAWAGQYGDQRVVRWWTHRERPVANALRSLAGAIRAAELTHDGAAGLTRHVGNARRKDTKLRDDEGQVLWVIRKDHVHSPRKIDAAMAATLGWEARGDAIAAGVLKRRRKVRAAGF